MELSRGQVFKCPGSGRKYKMYKQGTILTVWLVMMVMFSSMCSGAETMPLSCQPVTDVNSNLWTEAHKNPDGTANKFNKAYKDMPRRGHIGLQYHGQSVWYRNIKIKEL